MTPGNGRFLRDNAFLVAAVALPVIVIAFFLLATAVPRWLVPPPAYDLLIRATDSYNQTNPRVSVDFAVRNGRVEATVRPIPATHGYGQLAKLFLFDHATLSAREITVEFPENLVEGDPPRVIVVDAFAGRQVLPQAKAPDGYQFENRGRGGPGIVGGLFGMDRYNSEVSVVNRGRVIPIELPMPFPNVYVSALNPLGWLVDNTPR